MSKYLVWQKREFMFYEEGDWEQDQNYAEHEYTVELVPSELQPEVDDLIKSEEESK